MMYKKKVMHTIPDSIEEDVQVFHKKKARLENTKDVVYTSNENVSSEKKLRIEKTDDLV